jgi:hypothetical protein
VLGWTGELSVQARVRNRTAEQVERSGKIFLPRVPLCHCYAIVGNLARQTRRAKIEYGKILTSANSR